VGTVRALQLPDDPGIRWDLAVAEGDEVTIEFDPMIGKVTAPGADRAEAARRLASALERLHLGGVTTNRDFLVAVLRHEAFLAGDTTTDFISRVRPRTGPDLCDNGLANAVELAALWCCHRNRAGDRRWGALPPGFRNGPLPPTTITFALDDRVRTVAYRHQRDGSIRLGTADGALTGEAVEVLELDTTARVLSWSDRHIEAELGRTRFHSAVTATAAPQGPAGDLDRIWVQTPSGTAALVVAPRFTIPGSDPTGGGLVAPMPGRVIEVRVAADQPVEKGDTLLVLEAMKMEHRVTAPAEGTVAEVLVAVGDQVAKDQALLRLDPAADASDPSDPAAAPPADG
jgi:propionyl-CoA carboxylase alpha chain